MKSIMQRTQFYFTPVKLLAFAGLLVAIGCTAAVEAPPKIDVGTVSLLIDFPSDSQLDDVNIKVNCAAKATVFEILQRAKAEGMLDFESSSNLAQEPASIFVKTISGVGGVRDKFWTYTVNGELAKEGCGTRTVKPNDEIYWVFGEPPAELN